MFNHTQRSTKLTNQKKKKKEKETPEPSFYIFYFQVFY